MTDIAAKIDDVARTRFGLEYLYPFQRLVITNILAAAQADDGVDDDRWGRQIVILPTGAGKSLCFLLPAALLQGTTLIVYPLVSLMTDQERRIRAAGFSVAQLRGGQDRATRNSILNNVDGGNLDFLLSNPETLSQPAVLKRLGTGKIHHLVADEAHSISEWGDSFRPAYLQLTEIVASIAPRLCTAFTATASDHVIDRIREIVFPDKDAHLIRGNPDRENISYTVQPALSLSHGLRALFSRTSTRIPERDTEMLPVFRPGHALLLPAIVFCPTRFETQRCARIIESSLGSGRTGVYHAGLDRSEKARIEEWYFAASDGVLCATCAYGMGVDKGNIRTVIHSYVPETVEAYLQESGRAGRDRAPAQAIVLVTPEAQSRYRGRYSTGEVTEVDRAVFGISCRRSVLVEALGGTIDACSGCDVCASQQCTDISAGEGSVNPAYVPRSEAAKVLLSSVESDRTPRSLPQWLRIWRGRLHWNEAIGGTRRISGYGAFSHWTVAELQEAVAGLEKLGLLVVDSQLQTRRARQTSEELILPFRSAGSRKGHHPLVRRFETALRSSLRRRERRSEDNR